MNGSGGKGCLMPKRASQQKDTGVYLEKLQTKSTKSQDAWFIFITKKKKKITAPCLSSLLWEERVLNSGDKQSYTFSSCFVCLLFIIRPDTPRKRGCVLLFTQATVDTQLGRCHHRNLPFKAPSERHMVNSIKISHLGKKKPQTLLGL